MKKILITSFLLAMLVGCNWVQLTSEGRGVRLANSNEVGNCSRIGRTTSQTLSRVAIVERGSDKLQQELLTLARNEAGRMGGNTVAPESLISQGQQTFGVYTCQ